MNLQDKRRIKKIIEVLRVYRNDYAKKNDTAIASKFSRVMAILVEILRDEKDKRE